MPTLTIANEDATETAIREFVLTKIRLGIYEPDRPRRPKMEVLSFAIELLEFDDTDGIAHAAGPVVLDAPDGASEHFLRISLPLQLSETSCTIPDNTEFRAAYIVDLDLPSGGCKETAALANI